MKLPKQTRAVITGAASGLGRAMAIELGRSRGRIIIADVNLERAQETKTLVEQAGGQAEVVKCDVTQEQDLRSAAECADRLWGGTDLLINNAGVAAAGEVGTTSLEDWDWILGINLRGVILGCHVFLPAMKERKSGFIINVASSAGIASLPEMGSYNTTKAAVIALSETLYGELGKYNVAVSALCPTFVPTNLLDTFRAPQKHHGLAHAMFANASITPEEVARVTLRELQRGTLIIIPQTDGKLVWWAKRLAPGLLYRAIRQGQKTDFAARFLSKR